MTTSHIAAAALATVFAVSAPLAQAEPDLFSGIYRFAMPNQTGSFAVQSVDKGRWTVSSNETEDQPLKPFPIPGMPPRVLAAPDLVNEWFDEASPREKITCVAWTGSSRHTFPICRVPIGATYQVREAMSDKRSQSETGYIFIAGMPAGVMTGDLIRSPQ